MTNTPRAVVPEVDGQLVLDDPDAVAFIRAVGKVNCEKTFELNAERVGHFKKRIDERGLTSADVVIVILNVDDPHGGPITEMLMPNHNWQEYRERGEVPFARGLAARDGIEAAIGIFDPEASAKLREMKDVAVVVVDHQVAEIFPA